MAAARSGLWDRGAPVAVTFLGGVVASAASGAVLNGANLAAIGDGSADRWELFQFANAELVGAGTWALSLRLRGLAGTDALMPMVWPAGSRVVLLDRTVQQVDLAPGLRGLERTWRIGAASRGFAADDVAEWRLAFDGIGLRPLSIVHLRARSVPGGTDLSWIRRTRIDGDSWASSEVPLGEEREAYLLRVHRGESVLRELELGQAAWLYPAAMRAADGAAPVTVSVAQVSARFGPGPFRSVTV
jgi:hypothetical protein